MIVLGIDPGGTTGFAVVQRDGFRPLVTGELPLENLFTTLKKIITEHQPDKVVIEDIVKTGLLNSGKFSQIRAFEQTILACAHADRGKGFSYALQPPESTKKFRKDLPQGVKGKHARDAYKVACIWMGDNGCSN